jgi:UDP-N-acetylglucosamine diphosphorylase / glucose-1-phosphate thymidylyltransferase / UDP-N-acetylgalactosamine diphosphorylase / glucosamine-1-phosphate N-acetyltransferase / galactosamine-1-phosphate N-acetyltransferase
MQVIFLCGGNGKRMLPLKDNKFLLKFIGKTLLEHQLQLAIRVGLTNFILVCNPQSLEEVKSIAKRLSPASFEIAVQEKPLGIANALESVKDLISEEIIVVNPNDIFDDTVYTQILNSMQHDKATSRITGYRVKNYFPGGYLVTNENGYLTSIVEKPGAGNEPSELVNLLVHSHSNPKELLRYISQVETTNDDVYERALDMMCKDGQLIHIIPYSGAWHAIKYPWNILDAVQYFLDRAETYISPTAQISNHAVVDGKVIIGDNVRILEDAVIRGPVYIGPRAVIGNSTLVRGYSHIGADSIVGFGTEIKGSYVGNGCWFHMNYIGDSVVGENCNFGAGTITANWRFDKGPISVHVNGKSVETGMDKLGAIIGDDCRTGINVSIMPGIKIGPNSVIGPSVCLTEDVDSNTIVQSAAIRLSVRKITRHRRSKEEKL